MNPFTKFAFLEIYAHSLLLYQDNFHYTLKGTHPELNLTIKDTAFPEDHTLWKWFWVWSTQLNWVIGKEPGSLPGYGTWYTSFQVPIIMSNL